MAIVLDNIKQEGKHNIKEIRISSLTWYENILHENSDGVR